MRLSDDYRDTKTSQDRRPQGSRRQQTTRGGRTETNRGYGNAGRSAYDDSYGYDDTAEQRRRERRQNASHGSQFSNDKGRGKQSGSKRILYDARGTRIKNKGLAGWQRALLFYVLPYVVVNGLIFLLVTATPKVSLKVNDTVNYRTTQVEFTVKSLLPLKSLSASMESEPINFEKNGSTYRAEVSHNGNFYVETTALNGMRTSSFVSVNVLDDTPPSIDESSCKIEQGDLSFVITDVESGVNFDAIYGIYAGNKEVRPTHIDKETGAVTIPMYTDSIELHFEDMVGNAQAGTITATTGIDSDDNSNDSVETDSTTSSNHDATDRDEEINLSNGGDSGNAEEEAS